MPKAWTPYSEARAWRRRFFFLLALALAGYAFAALALYKCGE